MWDRQGEVRGLSGCAGQMLRRSFLARAVDLDTRKYAAGERDDRSQEPKTNPLVPQGTLEGLLLGTQIRYVLTL